MDLKQEYDSLVTNYNENKFEELFKNELGIYFLKMRSVSRTPLLKKLAQELKIDISKAPKGKLFEFMFCQKIPDDKLDNFIRQIYAEGRKSRIEREDYLDSQLYKLQVFDWGGFYQNAVEQTIINNYVKKIQDFEKLCDVIDSEINPKLKSYILCSWYNHWTSILIEDIFRDHSSTLPAVGLIKKVDFFWNNYPFDLKVTYFPEGFMGLKRKEKNLKPELTELKRFAKGHGIHYAKKAKKNEIFSELLTKISEDISEEAKEFIEAVHEQRKEIILEAENNPTEIIKWLYENQGTRRFDAANRLFLVLVNLKNLEESWKLKRNRKLLKAGIDKFLDNYKNFDLDELKITFNWEGKSFTTYSTILFIHLE